MNGGDPEVLATAAGNGGEIAVAEDGVFWTNSKYDREMDLGMWSLTHVPRNGTASVLWTSTTPLAVVGKSVTVSDESVFWLEQYSPTVLLKMPTTGGEPERLAESDDLRDLVSDNDAIYWSDGAAILMRPHDGGSIVTLNPEASANFLTVSGGALFWLSFNEDYMMVNSMPTSGGETVELARQDTPIPNGGTGRVCVAALAVDGETVYWSRSEDGRSGSGSIHQVSRTGGPATQTVDRLDMGPCSLAIANDSLYWADWDGLKMIPRE